MKQTSKSLKEKATGTALMNGQHLKSSTKVFTQNSKDIQSKHLMSSTMCTNLQKTHVFKPKQPPRYSSNLIFSQQEHWEKKRCNQLSSDVESRVDNWQSLDSFKLKNKNEKLKKWRLRHLDSQIASSIWNPLKKMTRDQIMPLDTIQKISKLCAKHNIRVTYTGPQTEVFNDLLKKYEATYENEVKEYHSRGSNRHDEEIKKRKHDTIIMEVPKDRPKRLKFLLEEARKLVDTSSAVQHESNDLSVTSNLQRVLSPGSQYKRFEDSGLVDVYNFMSMSTKALEDRVSELATVFIESVIDFGAIKIYMTSADFFLHNHMTIDDCANERTINDMYDLPTATVKENTYMNSATYYELSIHWGFVEILFTGGFYVVNQSPDLLLLGSSLKC